MPESLTAKERQFLLTEGQLRVLLTGAGLHTVDEVRHTGAPQEELEQWCHANAVRLVARQAERHPETVYRPPTWAPKAAALLWQIADEAVAEDYSYPLPEKGPIIDRINALLAELEER